MGIAPIVVGQVVKKIAPSLSSPGITACLDGTSRTLNCKLRCDSSLKEKKRRGKVVVSSRPEALTETTAVASACRFPIY
jgi:hypothetical protein